MSRFRFGSRSGAALRLALVVPADAPRAAAQSPSPPASPPAHKSVYGTTQRVGKSKNGVVMKADSGEQLAWRFSAPVVEEASHFKPGDPMIVIYRQVGPKDKRVTALAFPGTAANPTYVNMTGGRVT